MKTASPEEQIRSRLRELTTETRRVRQELQEMIRKNPDRTRAVSQDRGYKLKKRNG